MGFLIGRTHQVAKDNNDSLSGLTCLSVSPAVRSPLKNSQPSAILDSGATGQYFTPADAVALIDINEGAPTITVGSCTGEGAKSSATARLNLPNLPQQLEDGHIMPSFVHSLVGLGPFCDADCTVTFTKTDVTVYAPDGTPIITGWREADGAKLWRFALCPPDTEVWHHPSSKHATLQAFSAYDLPSVKALVRYYHATAGFPVRSTWLKAIKAGNYKSWPGLTYANATKYCPSADETFYGHFKQRRMGTRSTKPKAPPSPPVKLLQTAQPSLPKPETPPTPTNELHVWDGPINKLFLDGTGKFPTRARSGNQYIMIAYHHSTNCILMEPYKTKADHHRIQAYHNIMDRLQARGHSVDLHIMDNEISADFKKAITIDRKSAYQLVPPDMHRRNQAERAIQTGKDHFLAILAGVDPKFPHFMWDHLLPQAEITLNLLRQSRAQPSISAWEHYNGPINYDATPLNPLGCRVLIHNKPATRNSWDYRATEGYNVGVSLEHYRCSKVFDAKTKHIQVSDTVEFRHHRLTQPTITAHDQVIHSITNLTAALQNNPTPAIHSSNQLQAIESLRSVLTSWQQATSPQPTSVHPPSTAAQSPRVPAPISILRPTPPVPAARVPTPTPPARRPRVPTIPTDSTVWSHANSQRHTTTGMSKRRLTNLINEQLNDDASKPPPPAPPTPVPTSAPRVRFAPNTKPPAPTHQPVAHRTRSARQQQYAAAVADGATIPAPQSPPAAYKALTAASTASRRFPAAFLQHWAMPVFDPESGQMLEYRQLRNHPTLGHIWNESYSNELGRLCQGIGIGSKGDNNQRVAGTDTFRVIDYSEIPKERRKEITFTKVVCTVRPQKEDPNRTRITIGGNRICYPGDVGTPTASLDLVKLQLNSVVSRPGAKFACFDISNFYLETPLHRPEYVHIKLSDIPQEFIDEYDLHNHVHNGWVYFEINKSCYGLPQSGKLSNDQLRKRLYDFGYFECTTTPGLWKHKWRPITFVLIVDDFGIEYVGKEHAEHLLDALKQFYDNITVDWEGSKFAGIDLDWNYARRHCDRAVRLSMNGYIKKVLEKYNHPAPSKPQHSPAKHRPIQYGAKSQTVHIDNSQPLELKAIRRIQAIVGSLLYYARAVDNKLLVALSSISARQAAATADTLTAVNHLLDYVATYPSDGIIYRASNMILCAHSDAGFNNELNARSRAGAHVFLSEDVPYPAWNGPVLTIAQIIPFVMASAAEAELGALYITAKALVSLRQTLIEMGWPQPPTPVQCDNTTAVGVTNNTIIPQKLKAMDNRYHWLRCRHAQDQFRFYWDKGASNNGDYSTKNHPDIYHLSHREPFAGIPRW